MNAPIESSLLPSHQHGWQASLALRVESRDGRSVLAQNLHHGPLRVQKALYPEGDAVCQILMLHPPAGIAGGDQLRIDIAVAGGAHTQITTPGAGKWYRSSGPLATQTIQLDVAAGGVLEWLPQEAIVFDQARAASCTTLSLAEGAKAIGWDMVCLGRQASGERFTAGSFRQQIRLQRPDGSALWRENMQLAGNDEAIHSAVGLNGCSVFGSLWLAGVAPDAAVLAALRSLPLAGGQAGVTALPGLTLIRAQATASEALRQYFESAWALARRHVLQREALTPRIWRT